MAKCKICGMDGLTWDDNWGGRSLLRDPDTQLPHSCTGRRPVSFVNKVLDLSTMEIDVDWLCEEHGEVLKAWHCPINGCSTTSRIRRSYYNTLHKQD